MLPLIIRVIGCAWLCCALMCGLISSDASGQSITTAKPANVEMYSEFKTFTESDGLPNRGVRSLAVDGSHLWVGTDRGLAQFDGTQWKTWTTKDGLPDDTISSITVDPQTDDVWLGTWDHGLVRLTGGRFDIFDQLNSGLAGNFVYSLAIHRGKVNVTTIGGVSIYDAVADAWGLIEPRQADDSQLIFTSIVEAAGQLYASSLSGGVKELQHGDGPLHGTDVFQGSKLRPPEKIAGIASSENGKTLWFATQRAVYRRKNELGTWDRNDLPDAMSQDMYVQCVAGGEDGALWLGTDHGLCVLADWNTNTWVHYLYDPVDQLGKVTVYDATGVVQTVKPYFSIPYNNIRAIALDRKNVWIGTAEGLVRARNPIPIANVNPTIAQTKKPLPAENDTKSRNSARPAVAVYGPRNRTIALPGKQIDTRSHPDRADTQAVDRCMQQFNKQTVSNDKRIELFKMSPGYERYGWGLPEDDIVYFSQQSNVAGVVGLLDQRHREAAEVIARLEIPFVNAAVGSDFSEVDTLDNPWLFRCRGDEPRQHRALLDYVVNDLGLSRMAIVRTPGHENQLHLNWWKNHALKQKYSIAAEVYYAANATRTLDRDDFIEALTKSKPQVILTWADRKASADLLRKIRSAGIDALVVTSGDTVTDDFADIVDMSTGNVIALTPVSFYADEKNISSVEKAGFRESFEGLERSNLSLHKTRSYEATDHIFYAVSIVGKDRRRVKQVLQMMQFSAMGELHYERRHPMSNITYSRLIDGQWISQSLPVH